MKVRPLLYLTAIVAAILGATVVYLVLSVPNDLRADALMKTAREEITSGNHEKARQSLARVVQQYPRTDAAAAATVALSSLEKKERDDLARAVAQLRVQNEQQSRLIADLQKNVTTIGNRPAQVVTVQAPAPRPAATKVTPKKKTPPKKKTTTKRRRR
jgi:outer membrane protein assembly factor BamD (BamD/ComL family)